MRRIKDKKGWPLPYKVVQTWLEVFGNPELPEHPKKNTYYNYYPDGALCANGNPWMGTIRLGTTNNLMIAFAGGGEAVDDYSEQRPTVLYPTGGDKFYFNDVYFGELISRKGLNSPKQDNPFHDWNLLMIPYATGDFHCGANDYHFIDEQGVERVVHHHGYLNYRKMVDKIKKFVPNPDKVFVYGCSAGAFGTALLSSDIMERFPACRNVTFCVDSAAQELKNLQHIVNEMWKAPETVARHLKNDIVLDSLTAVHHNYGDRAKVMYLCTHRDAALANMQNYLDGRGMRMDKEGGDRFYRMLQELVRNLRENIPDVGLFFFDKPLGQAPEAELTVHTVMMDKSVFTTQSEGITAAQWAWDGVNGNRRQLGLGLLDL